MSIVLQGSTSGSITLQEPAVAGSTVLSLPAVTGTILTTTSPKAGNVIQVVQGSYATYATTTSSTFSDTGLSASITPTSASSKILVLVVLASAGKNSANSSTALQSRILRGSTNIFNMEGLFAHTNTSLFLSASATGIYLDSPATTSSTTYKVQYASATNTSLVYINNYWNTNGEATSTITLMEIAA